MLRKLQKILGASILFFFVGLLSVGALGSIHGSAHDAHAHHLIDCPFSNNTETICPMTALDHIAQLRTIFETTLPALITLSILGVAILSFIHTEKRTAENTRHRDVAFKHWRERIALACSYRVHQALFARGILHPKLF